MHGLWSRDCMHTTAPTVFREPDFCALWWSYFYFVATVVCPYAVALTAGAGHSACVQTQRGHVPVDSSQQVLLQERVPGTHPAGHPALRPTWQVLLTVVGAPAGTFRYSIFTSQSPIPFGQYRRADTLSTRGWSLARITHSVLVLSYHVFVMGCASQDKLLVALVAEWCARPSGRI